MKIRFNWRNRGGGLIGLVGVFGWNDKMTLHYGSVIETNIY